MQIFKIIPFLIYFNIINGFYIHDTFAKDYYPAHVSVIDHQHISDLYWDNNLSRVLSKDNEHGSQYTVLLYGKYSRAGMTLVIKVNLKESCYHKSVSLDAIVSVDTK